VVSSGRDQPGPRTPLDRHVADRHPALHREVPDRLAAVLDHVADPAVDADDRQDVQDQVLRGRAGRERTVDLDRERPRQPLREGLGREDVLDLGGADAERERPEGAVGRGVGVAADDHRTRLGEAELRADDVHDALVAAAHLEQPDAELLAVAPQRLHLRHRQLVLQRQLTADLPWVGRDVVVHRGEGEVGPAHGAPGLPDAVERLRRGHLVDEVQVDVEQVGLPLGGPDDVLVPDLLHDGLRGHRQLLEVVATRPQGNGRRGGRSSV
jgi:hypothetical protein